MASFPVQDPMNGRLLAKWNVAACVCVATALVLVLLITGWGALVDFHEVRLTLLQGEVGRLRSHAVRTVSKIEDRLIRPGSTLESAVREENEWLRDYWRRWVPRDKSRLYAAIVDDRGTVLMHTKPGYEGKALGTGWYKRVVWELDDDVVETHDQALTSEQAYDVMIPIVQNGRQLGTYHSGFDPDWYEEALAEKNASLRLRWFGVFGGVLTVVLVAGLSLHQIIRRTMLLREAVEMSRVRQFAELGELAAGIAHEIRNPLNAIRLNLHALQRMQKLGGDSAGGPESEAVIVEANREIERVEGLMRIMLGYARPEKAVNEDLELRCEIEAAVSFVKPVMQRDRVTVELQLPPGPAHVHLDRNRFRQVLLNLLNNAREATGPGGKIWVQLARRREGVELCIADNGPGVAAADRERIFDPFYSTKELGTGLGLALVKRFVEEAEGHVTCEASEYGGARFRILLPERSPDPSLL